MATVHDSKNVIWKFSRLLGITPLLFTSGIIKRTSVVAFILCFFYNDPCL